MSITTATIDAQIDAKLAAHSPNANDVDSFWLVTNAMFGNHTLETTL